VTGIERRDGWLRAVARRLRRLAGVRWAPLVGDRAVPTVRERAVVRAFYLGGAVAALLAGTYRRTSGAVRRTFTLGAAFLLVLLALWILAALLVLAVSPAALPAGSLLHAVAALVLAAVLVAELLGLR
jgi:hypothetical protein